MYRLVLTAMISGVRNSFACGISCQHFKCLHCLSTNCSDTERHLRHVYICSSHWFYPERRNRFSHLAAIFPSQTVCGNFLMLQLQTHTYLQMSVKRQKWGCVWEVAAVPEKSQEQRCWVVVVQDKYYLMYGIQVRDKKTVSSGTAIFSLPPLSCEKNRELF